MKTNPELQPIQHPAEIFPLAPIPGLLRSAWQPAVALSLLTASSAVMACAGGGFSHSPSINIGGPPYAVVPGGTFNVRERAWYNGNGCSVRARVRFVSGSCAGGSVGFSGSGVCSSGGDVNRTYTMNGAPTAACVIVAEGTDICGDYHGTTYTVGITQVITVDTAAPAGPITYGGTFNVAAHATSGYNVAVTTSGGCTGSGNTTGAGSPVTITMSSGTTSCVVYYNQAGGAQWNAATQVTSTTTAQKANQVITVTTPAPGSAEMGAVFNVAATAPGGAVTATGSGGCSGTGTGTVPITMTSGTTACTVTYSRAADANYNAAPNVPSTTTATMANQYITVTTEPPAAAVNGQVFTVAANSKSTTYNALTGLGVAITSSGSCTGSGTNSANITINAASGVCTINFNQPGVANNWNAAAQVTRYVTALATSCNGEGTYTSFRLNNSGGYVGWACNGGSISCSPSILDWSIQPGIGFKGHVLQTEENPNKTIRIQAAPDGSGYYNVINQTDNTCWTVGNAVYECSGTRTGSNCNASYLTALRDSAFPAQACDYNADHAKWQIVTDGSYMKLKTNGNVGAYGNHCIGTDGFGLSRLLLNDPDNFGDWGDVWVRNALPSCADTGARLVCSGYAPPTPNHIRFEFDPNAATKFGQPVTIKSCTTARGTVIGDTAPTCSPYVGTILLTPVATESTPNGSATWSGLSASPATLFTSTSSGIKLTNTQAESVTFTYTNPSVALTDAVLECVNTVDNKVIDCTVAGGGGMTFGTGSFGVVEYGNPLTSPNIYTKLANVPFPGVVPPFTAPNSGLTVRAIRTVAGVPSTLVSYTGSPTIDIIDATAAAGDGCSTGTALTNPAQANYPPAVAAAFTAGVLTIQPTVVIPKPLLRVRVYDAAVNGGEKFCSDTFTVRPTEFELALTNPGSPLVSGLSTTIGATGFSLTATVKSGWSTITKASTGAVTSGYAGTITTNTGQMHDWTTTPITISGVPTPRSITAVPAGSVTGSLGVVGGNPLSASGTIYYDNFGVVNFNWRDTVADKTYTTSYRAGLLGDLSDQTRLDTLTYPNPPNANSYDCILTLPTDSDYNGADPLNRTNPASLPNNAYSNVPGTSGTNFGKYGCYVGSTIPATTASSRFRPGWYDLSSSVSSVGSCGFTTVGTVFATHNPPTKYSSLTLTARSQAGTRMSLLTSGASSAPTFKIAPYNGTTAITDVTFTPAGLPTAYSSAWGSGATGGTLTVADLGLYSITSGTPLGAYDSFVIGVTVDDPDSVRFNAAQCVDNLGNVGTVPAPSGTTTTCIPPVTTYNPDFSINTQKGSTRVRYGMLKVENAYGSERLPLNVTISSLFRKWGGGWDLNTLDNCTSVPATTTMVGNFKGQLASQTGAIVAPTISAFSGGKAMMRFAAPVGGYTGSFDVALNLAAGVSTAGSCVTTWAGGNPNILPTAGANLLHLRGPWCGGTAYDKAPSARITFGAAKSPYLYRREKY